MDTPIKKSKVRLKVWVFCAICWPLMFSINHIEPPMLQWGVFWGLGIYAGSMWFVKCENCRAPFYSLTGEKGELPRLNILKVLFLPKTCPRCGIERI